MVGICAVIATTTVTITPLLFLHHLAGFTLLFQGFALINISCWWGLCHLHKKRNTQDATNFNALGFVLLSGFMSIMISVSVLSIHGKYLPGVAGKLSVAVQLFWATLASITALYIVQARWRNQRLSHNVVETQLYILKQRLHHHFLFNALNTTVCLISSHPDIASNTLTSLSELFRTMLQQKPIVALAEELEFVRNYIRIEHIRLGDRLNVKWDVPDVEHLHLKIPAMTIQPLVENAIYHGVETQEDGGTIQIKINPRKDYVFFEIRNPIGDALPLNRMEGNHMAQESIAKSLFHTYGKACQLTYEQRCGEYCVTFSIPRSQ